MNPTYEVWAGRVFVHQSTPTPERERYEIGRVFDDKTEAKAYASMYLRSRIKAMSEALEELAKL